MRISERNRIDNKQMPFQTQSTISSSPSEGSLKSLSSVCSLTTGESVEENAYVVLRLLIRRPECFGPALRGDGGNGLLAAMEEAIKISEDPSMDGPCTTYQSNRTLSVLDVDYCKDFLNVCACADTYFNMLRTEHNLIRLRTKLF